MLYEALRSGAHAMGGGNITVVDSVTEDMLYLIDAHWYQYPPMDSLWHSILMFYLIIVSVVAIAGNSMVIFIFCSTKSLRTPSNLLIVNLAFSDFFMMFTMGPPMIVNSWKETWMFGPLGCQIYGMFGSMWGCASIWNMTMISYDRYNVIVKGLSARPMTYTGAIMRILWVWGFSGIWTVAPMLGWSRYTPEGSLTACGTDYLSQDISAMSYLYAYSVACYFAPLFLIIYAYFFIIQAVAKHEKNMREQAKKMKVSSLRSGENNKVSRTEIRLAKICMFTIALWFVAWTPYLIINWMGMWKLGNVTPLTTVWASVFAKANSVYNPVVYGISHPRYRAALYKRFPSLECKSPSDDTESTASIATTDSHLTTAPTTTA